MEPSTYVGELWQTQSRLLCVIGRLEIASPPFRIDRVGAWEKNTGVAARELLAKEALTHLEHLYRVAFHLARDPHKSQDMVQETFVRALASHQQFRSGSNMKAWLTKILYNLFFDDYERQKRWLVRKEEFTREKDYEGLGLSVNPEPERDVLRQELKSVIRQCLGALPEEFRVPIVLVDMGELSYEEAAATLSCPVGTIRSRLSRGRRLMRQHLIAYVTGSESKIEGK
jgi:RNA polymerase sigma-70 factor (ECF subfamily)